MQESFITVGLSNNYFSNKKVSRSLGLVLELINTYVFPILPHNLTVVTHSLVFIHTVVRSMPTGLSIWISAWCNYVFMDFIFDHLDYCLCLVRLPLYLWKIVPYSMLEVLFGIQPFILYVCRTIIFDTIDYCLNLIFNYCVR